MTRVAPGWKPEHDYAPPGFYKRVCELYEAAGCSDVTVVEQPHLGGA